MRFITYTYYEFIRTIAQRLRDNENILLYCSCVIYEVISLKG